MAANTTSVSSNFEDISFNPFETQVLLDDNSDPDRILFNEQYFHSIEAGYYSVEDAKSKLQSTKTDSTFSILSINIRSINKNFENLKILLAECDFKFGMICITETWCSNDSFQNNSNFNLTNYRAIHLGRKEKRGGVYVNMFMNNICLKLEMTFRYQTTKNEHLCIEIINKQRKNIIVNTCYRPPGSKVKPFKKHVASVFNQVKRENKKMFFVGDLNINSLDYSSNSVVRNFINDILSYGAIPLINKPTRITKKSVKRNSNKNNCPEKITKKIRIINEIRTQQFNNALRNILEI